MCVYNVYVCVYNVYVCVCVCIYVCRYVLCRGGSRLVWAGKSICNDHLEATRPEGKVLAKGGYFLLILGCGPTNKLLYGYTVTLDCIFPRVKYVLTFCADLHSYG